MELMAALQFECRKMVKIIIKYISMVSILFLFGIIILDFIFLPAYVGFNNEHYLPDVRGDYVEKANHTLISLGFKTEFVYSPFSEETIPNTIVKMFPRAFTKVKEGRTIKLTVADSKKDFIMPNLKGESLRNAKILINRLGLIIDTVMYEYNNSIKLDNITFQLPKAGKIVTSFSKVILGVSKGAAPDYYIVPDILNLSLKKAKKKIIKSGLKIGDITYEYQPKLLNNTVIEQNMTAGMRVSFPATIHLIISKDKE